MGNILGASKRDFMIRFKSTKVFVKVLKRQIEVKDDKND